jgi:O-succinylbenzoic acid--CoA ligase
VNEAPTGGIVPDWLAARTRLNPAREALAFAGERWTFRELDGRVGAAARRLREAGLAPGERVAVLARPCAAYAVSVHAVPRAGGVLVPLNARLAEPELAWQLADCGPAILLHDASTASTAESLALGRPELRMASLDALARPPEAPDAHEASPFDLDAVHTIVYTSGTSARPKGTMLTFGNHLWSALASALNLGLRDDDRWLCCMPINHVGGLAILLRGVIYGLPVLLHDGFNAAAVNRAVDEERVTHLSLVATTLTRLLAERGERPFPDTLRAVLVGGGPVPPTLLREAARRRLPALQTYGLTEAASQVATLSPEDAQAHAGSAGRALYPTEVRIVDGEGRQLPAGEPGEIVVRGPTVMRCYLDRPGETAAVLRNGWLHTGDAGYLDGEGYLYVLDRRDDLIVSGGENVYPAEVEAVLRAHPAVIDAAVVGVDDPVWGRRPAAVVKARPPVPSAEALIAFCQERLAAYKVPVAVRFAEVPRTPSGKLLRRELREGWT